MYVALIYQVVPDYLDKRTAHRSNHFDYLKPYHDRGQLIMGGAFDTVSEGAMLIFNVDDINIIEEFAKSDPYVLNGVVTNWKVLKWNVAIGGE